MNYPLLIGVTVTVLALILGVVFYLRSHPINAIKHSSDASASASSASASAQVTADIATSTANDPNASNASKAQTAQAAARASLAADEAIRQSNAAQAVANDTTQAINNAVNAQAVANAQAAVNAQAAANAKANANAQAATQAAANAQAATQATANAAQAAADAAHAKAIADAQAAANTASAKAAANAKAAAEAKAIADAAHAKAIADAQAAAEAVATANAKAAADAKAAAQAKAAAEAKAAANAKAAAEAVAAANAKAAAQAAANAKAAAEAAASAKAAAEAAANAAADKAKIAAGWSPNAPFDYQEVYTISPADNPKLFMTSSESTFPITPAAEQGSSVVLSDTPGIFSHWAIKATNIPNAYTIAAIWNQDLALNASGGISPGANIILNGTDRMNAPINSVWTFLTYGNGTWIVMAGSLDSIDGKAAQNSMSVAGNPKFPNTMGSNNGDIFQIYSNDYLGGWLITKL